MTPEQFGVLADGGWGELIPMLIFVGIWVIGGIGKVMSGRENSSDKQDESTKKLIEMAKKYKAMKETGQQREVPKEETPFARTVRTTDRKPGNLSEWDRRQQEKKQQVQQRRTQSDTPGYVPQKQKPPEAIPVAKAVPEVQPVRPVYKPPKTQQKPRPKRASRPIPKQPQRIPVARPAAMSTPEKKRPKQAHQKAPEAGQSLKSLLKQKRSLRSAIILKEILDSPVALRESW